MLHDAQILALLRKPVNTVTENLSADERSLDQLYEAAQTESGPLVVALGGDAQAQWDGLRVAFAQRFPKVKLDLTVDFSKYHDSKMDRYLQADKHYCDVLFLQDLHVYCRYKHQNILLPYKPPTFHDMYTAHQDPDGAYLGMSIWQFGSFLYDNTKFSKEDLPKNYLDLLDPKWKGKIIATYPNDDDAVGYLFSLRIGRYGWEWLEKFNEQSRLEKRPKKYVVGNDQRCLSFTTAGYSLESSALSWQPPEPTERFMSWSQTACILKSTTRPETAKLFIAYCCSKEFQPVLSAGGKQPTMLKSLNRKKGVPSQDDHPSTNMNGFRVYDLDRQMADWWGMQFESIIGSVQGVSPLDVYDFDDSRAL